MNRTNIVDGSDPVAGQITGATTTARDLNTTASRATATAGDRTMTVSRLKTSLTDLTTPVSDLTKTATDLTTTASRLKAAVSVAATLLGMLSLISAGMRGASPSRALPRCHVVAVALLASVGSSKTLAQSTTGPIRVAQEIASGSGIFSSNVLGVVLPWNRTSLHPGDIYAYGSPIGASWNGDLLDTFGGVMADRSHMMFANTAGTSSNIRCGTTGPATSLFWVHDRGGDPTGNPDGGQAKTIVRVIGSTLDPCRAIQDGENGSTLEPTDSYAADTSVSGETTFSADNDWLACCTDGYTIDELAGAWRIEARYADWSGSTAAHSVLTGLNSWRAYSSEGQSFPLRLQADLTVEFRPLAQCEVVAYPSRLLANTGPMATARVSVNATGAIGYQWRRVGGPNVPGATSAVLTFNPLTCASTGAYECVVTRPAPCNPSTVVSNSVTLSFCPADFNCGGSVSIQDIFDFLAAYFAGNAAADFNHTGAVTVQDIFDFLAAYFAGC